MQKSPTEKAHTGKVLEKNPSTTEIKVNRDELLKILVRIEDALSEVRELKAKIQK